MEGAGQGADQGIWLLIVAVAIGGVLVLAAFALTLQTAVQALRPDSWQTRWAKHSYVTFAWQELGRGIYFGYLCALGLSPLTTAAFLDREDFWPLFLLGSAYVWGVSALAAYFIMVIPGFFGFAFERSARGQIGSLNLLSQLAIVSVVSAPLAYLFIDMVLPRAAILVGTIFDIVVTYGRVLF